MKRRGVEIAAFLIVGGLSAVIDVGVFFLLTTIGTPPVIATMISFLSAFIVNFTGNRHLVFRVRRDSRQLVRYVALVIINLGLSAGLVAAGIALGFHPGVAKVFSMFVIAALNYVLMRRWVFRVGSETSPESVS